MSHDEEVDGKVPEQASSKEVSFDEVLSRLRRVVDRLEGDELTLEQSLTAFEEGVRLSRRGAAMLDSAERRVEVLLQGDDATPRTEPLDLSDQEASSHREPRLEPSRDQ